MKKFFDKFVDSFVNLKSFITVSIVYGYMYMMIFEKTIPKDYTTFTYIVLASLFGLKVFKMVKYGISPDEKDGEK